MTPGGPTRIERLERWLEEHALHLALPVCLVVLALLGARIWRHRERARGDTRFYQRGAQRYLAGENLYYQQDRPRPAGYAPVTGYTYLPPFALGCLWMAPLPYPAVQAVWLVVGLACALTTIRLAATLHARPPPAPLLITTLAVALVLRLGWNDLSHGQSNWLLALLLVVVLRRRRGALAGVALGAALALKPTAWPLLPFFLLLGRWRLAGACAATGGGLVLLSLLRYGGQAPALLADWFALMRQFALDSALSPGNASLTGLLTRLLAGYRPSAAEPLHTIAGALPPAQALGLARGVTALVGLALFALCVRVARRTDDDDPAPAVAVVLLGALVSPVTWKAHLVVLLFALVLLGARLLRAPTRGRLALAVAIALLLVLPSRALLDLSGLERLGSLTVVVLALLLALLRPEPAEASA